MDEPTFKSLGWVRNGIRYLLELISALSFLLLTVGLVSASWNFLDKDAIFGNAPQLQSLWALDQALAIDANLPLTFVVLFGAIKRKDWVFVAIYSVIGIMLLFVASIILGTESMRQALNISFNEAAREIHVPVELLTLVRSAATIGLVAMSGLNLTMLHVNKIKDPTPELKAEVKEEATNVDPNSTPIPAQTTSTELPSPEPEPKQDKKKPEDRYPKYLELMSTNPNASIPWLVKELGVSSSTVSNYRRKSKGKSGKSNNDELEQVQQSRSIPEEAVS